MHVGAVLAVGTGGEQGRPGVKQLYDRNLTDRVGCRALRLQVAIALPFPSLQEGGNTAKLP